MVDVIKKQTYFVVLISALLPLLLFSVIAFSQLRAGINYSSSNKIAAVRDEWLVRYKTEYRRLFGRLDSASGLGKISVPVFSGDGFSESCYSAAVESLIIEEAAVSEAIFFDDDYVPVVKIDQSGLAVIDGYYPEVRLALQDIVFFDERVSLDIQLPDGTSSLYVFYRLEGLDIGANYIAWKINYEWLQDTLPSSEDYIRSLYNDKYQIIASNGELRRWSSNITEQTERMIDGFSETETFSGVLHSFSFVDLGETAIFGDLTVNNASSEKRNRSFLISSVFFILFTAVIAVIFAWSFSGRLVRYGEAVLIKKYYSGEMKFFKRLEDNVRRLRGDADSIAEMQTRLGYLLNDINTIEQQLSEGSEDNSG